MIRKSSSKGDDLFYESSRFNAMSLEIRPMSLEIRPMSLDIRNMYRDSDQVMERDLDRARMLLERFRLQLVARKYRAEEFKLLDTLIHASNCRDTHCRMEGCLDAQNYWVSLLLVSDEESLANFIEDESLGQEFLDYCVKSNDVLKSLV